MGDSDVVGEGLVTCAKGSSFYLNTSIRQLAGGVIKFSIEDGRKWKASINSLNKDEEDMIAPVRTAK